MATGLARSSPVAVSFRFYAELNDFLPAARRQREFAVSCAPDASLKHVIEALGVPHTEVELILANGEPADLARLLADGDRISVYPRFATLRLARPAPLGEAKGCRFLADAHLGGLARLLRMAGFDTLYDNRWADAEIVARAGAEGRIVLTRDRELLKRRGVSHGCYVHALEPEAQLAEIARRLDLAGRMQPFSLCLACNAPLRPADKAQVVDRLPPGVAERQQRFSTCDACHGVFWEGSHWRRMRAVLDAALAAADGTDQ